MLAKLSIDPQAIPGYSLRDGVIRQGSRIWIGTNVALQQKLLFATHSSALGGTFGFSSNLYQTQTVICLARNEI
jgi:hypothetical protein